MNFSQTEAYLARRKKFQQKKRDREKSEFPNVLDLSGRLSLSEKRLLSKGLGFVPTKCKNSDPQLFFSQFTNSVKRKLAPKRVESALPKPFHLKMPQRETKNETNFPAQQSDLSSFLRSLESTLRLRMETSLASDLKPNLPSDEISALKTIRYKHEVVIKKSDKGNQIVVMNRNDYIRMGLRHLSDKQTYREIPESLMAKNQNKLAEVLNEMEDRKVLTGSQVGFLSGHNQFGIRNIYFLPKAHKSRKEWVEGVPPGRPIVANVGTEFAESSRFVTQILNHCLRDCPFLLKNSQEFLEKITDARCLINRNALEDLKIISADIEACYPSIPQDLAMIAVEKALQAGKSKNSMLTDAVVSGTLKLLQLQMFNNDIYFNNKWYLQVKGISMGQSWAPTVCNIYFASMDSYIVARYKPIFYGRYVDDTFFVWQHSQNALTEMMDDLNSRWPGIKLNFQVSSGSVTFLDVELYIERLAPEILLYRPYFKPTDTHELLHRTSNHPNHVFSGICRSTVSRMQRNSSKEAYVDLALNQIRAAILPRGYGKKFLDEHLSNRQLTTKPKAREVLPLVVDFDPRITKDLRWAKQEWTIFLDNHPAYKARLPEITLAWRCTKNLGSMIINKNSDD